MPHIPKSWLLRISAECQRCSVRSLFWVGQKYMWLNPAQPMISPLSAQPHSQHSARPHRISPCACTAQHLAMEPGICSADYSGALFAHLPLLQYSILQIPDASAVQNYYFLPPQLGDTITLLVIHFFALQQGVPWQNLSKYGESPHLFSLSQRWQLCLIDV